MGKQKLRKFKEIGTFENVIEYAGHQAPDNHLYQGKWGKEIFGDNRPIILELACGKGDYTISMAKMFPDKNFIGVDIKGNRIWRGAKTCIEEGITNAVFLRTQIELIADFFTSGEVDEIWITFPDPFSKQRNTNRRLTAPVFLDKYRKILKKDGLVHLKTDADDLFAYTLEVIQEQQLNILQKTEDVYQTHANDPLLQIQTYYERMHLEAGKKIKYVCFQLERY